MLRAQGHPETACPGPVVNPEIASPCADTAPGHLNAWSFFPVVHLYHISQKYKSHNGLEMKNKKSNWSFATGGLRSTTLADKRPEGLGHRKSALLRYTFKSRGVHSWYAMCRAVTKEAWSEQGQVLKSPWSTISW